MSLISVQNLTFSYDTHYENIFENVSIQLDTQWKLGFVGRNGRGKTTFMQLLMGKYPYSGAISTSVAFEYFPFPTPEKSMTALDFAYHTAPNLALWQLERELSLLAVSDDIYDRPFSTLSLGEQTKVMIALLFVKENHFLLIDEPTNHLDQEGRRKLSQYLNKKTGFILVSHDRNFLDGCIDHVLSIQKNQIDIQKGNFTSWWQNKQQQDQYELDQNKKAEKEIKKLSAAAKRASNWSDTVEKSKIGSHVYDRGHVGHKAAKMMKRAKNIESRKEKSLEEKSLLLKNIETVEDLSISPLAFHKNLYMEGNDITIQYEKKALFPQVSFVVEKGERIAVYGRNGAGKSSLIKLMAGEAVPFTGQFYTAPQLKISYVPQDTSFLEGDLKEFAGLHQIDESLFKAILRKLDFSRVQFEKDMSHFSAGQKKKVLLAKSLCEKAHLYIWDEPLNYIDIYSRMQIENLLLQYQPTMVLIEHDAAFIKRVATKKLELL